MLDNNPGLRVVCGASLSERLAIDGSLFPITLLCPIGRPYCGVLSTHPQFPQTSSRPCCTAPGAVPRAVCCVPIPPAHSPAPLCGTRLGGTTFSLVQGRWRHGSGRFRWSSAQHGGPNQVTSETAWRGDTWICRLRVHWLCVWAKPPA